jgi:GAF domain-containing protein
MTSATTLDHPSHDELLSQLEHLLDRAEPLITHMANMAALLYWSLPDVNWLGFYLAKGDRLLLGPFQGKPACTVIPFGAGVCGKAAADSQTQRVADVHTFPGHIACDTASSAEVVVPLLSSGRLWGVLDVDSPVKDRFTEADVLFLERSAAILQQRYHDAGGLLFPLDNTA